MSPTTRVLGHPVEITGDPGDTYVENLPDEMDDDVLAFLGRTVPSDVVAVDVGANIGLHAIALSRLAPDGVIHAFEASPRTAQHLATNLTTNGAGNVTVQPVALSAEPGELSFFYNEEFAAGSTRLDNATGVAREQMSAGEVRVAAITLDAFTAEAGLDRIDLVKIDVEGYDIDVLRGGAQTIAKYRPVVVMEFATFAITTHRQLLPADVLGEFRTIFDHVYVIERWGHVREVVNDHDAWGLLYENANVQAVQDIVGTFDDSRLADVVAKVAADRPPPPTPDAGLDAALAYERQRNADLTDELANAHVRMKELDDTIVAYEQTLSWRVTKPLRAIRRLKPKG